jgi:uncharacterized protein with von Willebrand factor type A (vWA) domain
VSDDLVAHLAELAGALRGAGVRVAAGDEIDALRALVRSDLGDPDEVRLALRVHVQDPPRRPGLVRRALRSTVARPRQATRSRGETRLARRRTDRAPRTAGHEPSPRHERPPSRRLAEGDEPGASARRCCCARSASSAATSATSTEMEPLLERLADKLATAQSRRLVPVRLRGRADLRRSLRRARWPPAASS